MAETVSLNVPSDIKKLTIPQLKTLCDNLRQEIISVAKQNGGHLSSNLGIVEAVVAIHYVFDLPADKLIFDVGHQCYSHKILSGRAVNFSSIRTDGGLSGFPDREESEYDPFTAGHAGTSIAAGIGYCQARDVKKENYAVVVLVGDGSFVNGLNLEAVTSSDIKPKNFVVILNDNEMSISKNHNALYKLLAERAPERVYVRSKNFIRRLFGDGKVGRTLKKIKNKLKSALGLNIEYRRFGFKFRGAVDGNNLKKMIKTLKKVKADAKNNAVFLHITTQKGKGYSFTEEHSDTYHGIGKNFCQKNGEFSTVLGEYINSQIDDGKNIMAITAGMKNGTGLVRVENAHKDRFADVGIAEEYAVTLAAGMAAGGIRPIVAVYSTFLQRAYDQILHDVCLQNLPVIFCIDRAGLVGADGKTHQGVFDLSFLTHFPNMTVFAPASVEEFKDILDYALTLSSPVAIRYPCDEGLNFQNSPIKEKPWLTLKEGETATVIAEGPRMLKIALEINKLSNGTIGVINARQIKPLCTEVLDAVKTPVAVLEENSIIGGLGSLILNYYSASDSDKKAYLYGVKDKFIKHGSIKSQFAENGLTAEDIYKDLLNRIKSEKRYGKKD